MTSKREPKPPTCLQTDGHPPHLRTVHFNNPRCPLRVLVHDLTVRA
jgi:hypothetical protein